MVWGEGKGGDNGDNQDNFNSLAYNGNRPGNNNSSTNSNNGVLYAFLT